MRSIREAVRQRSAGFSLRQISSNIGLSYGAVHDLLGRAAVHHIDWPIPEEMDDAQLEALLYPVVSVNDERPQPDMEQIDRELRKKGVTLQLLWQEYKAHHPEGFQYTAFCARVRAWRKTQEPTMRQWHKAGEKVFVDFAGPTLPYVTPETGEVREAHCFVAALGASQYIYVHVFGSEDLQAWILGCCMAFEFFGGVPEVLVPDNPKAAVLKACRYEPQLNPTFLEMAQHYGVTAIAARPRRPKDKAKVENAVQQVERWVLAPLRDRTFFSLAEIQEEVAKRVADVNNKPFQKREGCRRSLYEEVDKPALRPLPTSRYDFATWTMAKVSIDYHIEVGKALYSVPYQLIHQRVDVRLGARTVDIFFRHRQVASHARAWRPGDRRTNPDHMPQAHRHHAEWTPSRMVHWASEIGPNTQTVVQALLERHIHPEANYRACLGILHLGKRLGRDRLENACGRALAIESISYRSIRSILDNGLDRVPLPEPAFERPACTHDNVRGPGYYAAEGEVTL